MPYINIVIKPLQFHKLKRVANEIINYKPPFIKSFHQNIKRIWQILTITFF